MISLIALAKVATLAAALTTAPTSSVSAVTTAPAGSTFQVGALSGIHTKPLAYTNGLCFYVNSAAAGQPVRLGDCAHTNQWDYFSNGQLSPSGHDNVAVGDSGGTPVLKNEPTTVIDSDAVKTNANGSYFELDMTTRIGVDTHMYLHNNGNGNAIGGDNIGGDLANFYRMLAD